MFVKPGTDKVEVDSQWMKEIIRLGVKCLIKLLPSKVLELHTSHGIGTEAAPERPGTPKEYVFENFPDG
jgi:hypothetical protein